MAIYTLCWHRAGSTFDNLICIQMWLPTLCAGIALPLILVLQFWSESGYLHVVLVSHWVPFWCCNLDQKASTCALCAFCTGSDFGNGIWIQEWLPTLCAGVALHLISILECWSKSGYLHFVLVSHWIEFWWWSLNWKVAAYTLCLRCTASNFDIEMLTSTQQLEIICDPNNGYLPFVLVTQWVQFW